MTGIADMKDSTPRIAAEFTDFASSVSWRQARVRATVRHRGIPPPGRIGLSPLSTRLRRIRLLE